MKFTKQELAQLIRVQKNFFDVVRLVDAAMMTQYNLTDSGELVPEEYQCYAVWNKNNRCENCISAKAFSLQTKLTKFEFVDDEVYFVMSSYIELDGVPYLLEMVTHLNDETLFGAYGKEQFIYNIEKYNKKMYFDVLTGAYNRRYFEEQLKMLNNANAIAEIDLDYFKQANDTYGHPAGDEVLKKIVEVCNNNVRRDDSIIRMGGDEFIILFRGIVIDVFRKKLENIRQEISEIKFPKYPDLKSSASIGGCICQEPTCCLTVSDMMIKSDKALYVSKETKNTVTIEVI